MENLHFSWIDYILFVSMLIISVAIGIYYGFFAKQDKTIDGYLLGGKNMNYFPVAMSLIASCISSVNLVVFPTETYIFGTMYMLTLLFEMLIGFIIHYAFLPVFWKLKISTVYEYLELRFDRKIRMIACIVYALVYFIYTSFTIYSASLTFSQASGFNTFAIAAVMSAICIFYTTVGGLKAVIWTDTLQFFVILLTLVCVLAIGITSTGGFAVEWKRAENGERIEFFNMDIDPTIRLSFWSNLIGSLFRLTAFVATSQHTVQRFLTVKDIEDSRRVLWIFIIVHAIMQMLLLLFGIIMYALYYNCDPLSAGYIRKPDQILSYYILDMSKQILIPGVPGLFIAGMISASLSTASTTLNSISALIYDISPLLVSQNIIDKHANSILRITTSLVGIASFALIFLIDNLGSLLELLTSLHGISLAPILGVFILALVFPFSNKKGALTGMIISVIFMIFYNIRREMYVWDGKLKNTGMKPLFTEDCNITNLVSTGTPTYYNSSKEKQFLSCRITPFDDQSPEEISWFYRISFAYFIPIGCILTLIVGLPVSWFTYDIPSPNAHNALSPCIRKLLGKYQTKSRKASNEEHHLKLKRDNGIDNDQQCAKYTFE